jgi:hypothetical protein
MPIPRMRSRPPSIRYGTPDGGDDVRAGGSVGQRCRERSAGCLVIVWLAIAGLLTGGVDAASASTSSVGCPPVFVLASRGSGDTLGKDHGLSAPGLAFTSELRQLMPDVSSWANPYPAVGVFSWNLRQLANGAGAITKLPVLGAYHASVVQGKRLLDAEVASLTSACGHRTALVLVGYSQGAQVTADVYQRQLTAGQRSNVAGVVLFGDPYFDGGDRRVDRGSFSGRRDGLLGRRPPFGKTGRTLVLSYCHSHDPICQGLFFRLGPTRTLDPGSLTFKQHENYTRFGEPQSAAELIAERLGAAVTLGLPWAPNGEGYGQVQPSAIFSGGDPTSLVERIHWRDWGQPTATGDGTGDFVWPGESVASGSVLSHAILVAWDLGQCAGQLTYRRLTWYFPHYGQTSGYGWWLDPCTGAQAPYKPPRNCAAVAIRSPGGYASQVQVYGIKCSKARSIIASSPSVRYLYGGEARFRHDGLYCGTEGSVGGLGPPTLFECARGRVDILFEVAP